MSKNPRNSTVMIGDRELSSENRVFLVAELGINHNGELQMAKELIDIAADAGCDAVKFQKRTPDVCVPEDEKQVERDTPWGTMTYLDYRYRIEFGLEEYQEIDRHCKEKGMIWFASGWDPDSVDFIEQFDPPCHKVASACLTDHELLKRVRRTGKPVILSTGMSTLNEIEQAVEHLGREGLILCQSTSTYPCPVEELNLRALTSLHEQFGCPVGFSSHELGMEMTPIAVALGACLIERHITLDKDLWGSDHQASLDPSELKQLRTLIDRVQDALGDGVKRVYDSELPCKRKLRRFP